MTDMTLCSRSALTAAATAGLAMWLVSSRSSATGLPFVSYTATAKTVRLLAPLDDGVPSPTIGETFDIIESTIVVDAEHPLAPGEVLVKVLCMSVDPYLRGAIKSINGLTGEAKSSEPRVMEGFVAGTIVASNADEWIAGDRFGANLPFSTVQRAKLGRTIAWKLTDVVSEAEISLGLGIFGMPGATAYGGVTDILRPSTKPGAKEIIFVSSAAGAVGSMVGQIAKGVYGATVIGSTGGPEKVRTILSKYAFDFAIDHKALPKKAADGSWEERKAALLAKLKEVAPGGLDMMFSNVGQDHFEAGFESLRPRGRIAVCGQIAAYSDAAAKQPVINPGQMIYTFQRVEGFVCMPWLSGQKGAWLSDMGQWYRDGIVKPTETKVHGVECWPAAFNRLFERTERKSGKMVVMMADGDWGQETLRTKA